MELVAVKRMDRLEVPARTDEKESSWRMKGHDYRFVRGVGCRGLLKIAKNTYRTLAQDIGRDAMWREICDASALTVDGPGAETSPEYSSAALLLSPPLRLVEPFRNGSMVIGAP